MTIANADPRPESLAPSAAQRRTGIDEARSWQMQPIAHITSCEFAAGCHTVHTGGSRQGSPALRRDGDPIQIDAENGRLDVEGIDLATRNAQEQPLSEATFGTRRELFECFRQLVGRRDERVLVFARPAVTDEVLA